MLIGAENNIVNADVPGVITSIILNIFKRIERSAPELSEISAET